MKVISYSRKNFESLTPLELPNEVLNTEAKMYWFEYKGKKMILKKPFYLDNQSFANKLYTIEMLSTYSDCLPESFCIPEYLLSVNNNVKGFTIPYIEGPTLTTLLLLDSIDLSEKLYYLKYIGIILEQLKTIRNNKNTPLSILYINDLQDSNFIVDIKRKSLKIIDLDSCRICRSYPTPARYLTSNGIYNYCKNQNKYLFSDDKLTDVNIIANEESDLYCYSSIILNFLYGHRADNMKLNEFYEYLNYLEHIGLNKDLINSFYLLVEGAPNENPMYYIGSLTNEQFHRAKSLVYQKTKDIILNQK